MREEQPLSWDDAGLAIIYGVMGYCLLLLGAQIYVLLRDGVWISLPILNLFVTPPPESVSFNPNHLIPTGLADGSWIAQPHDWLGLHKALSWLLQSIHISVAILLLLFAAPALYGRRKKAP
jgi:hypothetical protein